MGSLSIWHWLTTLVVVMVLFIPVYFLPIIVTLVRHHQNRLAISLVDMLLGWTVIGWIVAMVWALTQVTPRQNAPSQQYALPGKQGRQEPKF